MDVFDVREKLIEDYKEFTSSFVEPRDPRVHEHVTRLVALGYQWPAPYLSLNPNFASGGTVDELVHEGLLHPDNQRVFRIKHGKDDPGSQSMRLHQHQLEAITTARSGKSYVLTTGTGSGKSLSYIVPIVDRVLRAKADGTYRPGVKAIIVYPMNALANSQLHELEKFLCWGLPGNDPPVRFDRYTGQEDAEARRRILADPPDILLTNYVMLELVLTRRKERDRLVRAARGLWFLVLDELHTYRGRQGADVAFLVRRTRDACAASGLQCVGTSATMTSEGSIVDQRTEVAAVASRLFGTVVEPGNVIGETLRKATTTPQGGAATLKLLSERVRYWDDGGGDTTDFATFSADPLAHWVESAFGVQNEAGTDRLVRRRPATVPDAADNLADLTGERPATCLNAIQAILQAGARIKHPETDRPVFAFRLHQFLSKGDNVYVTIEPSAQRHITSRYQTVSPESTEIERKILVPLAFCRECGQEYLIVRRSVSGFEAGSDSDIGNGDSGYLYISDDQPWPDDHDVLLRDARLPYSWTMLADDGSTIVAPGKEKYLPEVVHVDTGGAEVPAGRGVPAAWVTTPFRFCLRCQVSYERQRGKDFAQLAKLSVEGRSSALSVIGASVVRALRAAPDLDKQARKLLSFVDNRQDASLQAGHFNDFVQVVQMRGALYRAVDTEVDGLTHERVAQRVTEALHLELPQFARRPDVRYGKEEIWRALREVVNYRLYLDLERGWRVTMPNLEQTGLLRITYRYLDEVANDQEIWANSHHLLRDDKPEHRYEIAATLLDELRRNLAIDVRCLTEEGFDEIRKLSQQHLAEPWKLGDRERAIVAGIAFPKPSSKGRPRSYLHLSGRGALGKYLIRQYGTACKVGDAQDIIRDLLKVLAEASLVIQVVPGDGDDMIGGYRLRSDALIWHAGEGKVGAEDRVRKVLSGEAGARVNTFFRDLYRDTSRLLAGLQAKEHTAQVDPKQRQEREREFRDGDLPLLFCSPTMELGVDINALNAVALRNVPPTPANYAQRAGRAGRSGQPALVVTYCSTGNAHDQYYFKRPSLMVGGSVRPPRLDLANEDLVRSHLQAIWLAETGEELPSSLVGLMETGGEQPTLKLKAKIESALRDPDARARAVTRAEATLAGDVERELHAAPWWRPTWIADKIENAFTEFENALDRWRTLYRAARKEYEVQGRRAVDTNVSAWAREEAKRRADDARVQLNLLGNEDSDEPQTDFYTFRYLASEGFLPGYSFPRLPLAAYIPGLYGGQRHGGDYIHRPRFIGISEFGPGALIYHEGARYMVRGVQLQQAAAPGQEGVLTTSSRRCVACGHLHDDDVGIDRCDNCKVLLDGADTNLLRLYTVRTQRRERISSDEEERRRSGFQIETSYRFHHHGSRPGRIAATVASAGEPALATLVYGDAATVRRANLGLTRRKDERIRGFWLDTTSGEWLSEKKAAEMTTDEEDVGAADEVKLKQRVIPYVQDRRNILIFQLAEKATEETARSLLHALERGIEAEFQLEDSELTGELLPDPDERGRMLFIESAEGGAGVLRRLVEEPDAVSRAARTALDIAHLDRETGEEIEQGAGDEDRCVQGCYDCLLSYSNQPYHKQIDRHLIVDLLLELADASATVTGGPAATQQMLELDGPAGEFVSWLAQAAYRAPDELNQRIAGARPDLIYREAKAAVFVDVPGEPIDDGRDVDAEESLYDAGWTPIRVKSGDWQQAVEQYPSVFGRHQGGST